MNYPIQHHDGEDRRQVHVRVPEQRASPLLRLIAPQAYREVDQPATENHSSGQVEVAHDAHHEEHEGESQQEQRVEQDLPPCLRLALDHWQHGYAGLLIVFLDQQ